MNTKIFNKIERKNIFKLFLTNKKLKFSEIEKELKIRSNQLAYHLEILLKEKILVNENNFYEISKSAEKFIPLFSNLNFKNISPLPIVLIILENNKDEILLIKRKERPYQNLYGLIGGRILLNEDYKEASFRILENKIKIRNSKFISLNEISFEKIKEKEIIKHNFILFLTRFKKNGNDIFKNKELEFKWINLKNISKLKIIKSDKYLIENYFNKQINISHLNIEEKNGKIIKFTLKK